MKNMLRKKVKERVNDLRLKANFKMLEVCRNTTEESLNDITLPINQSAML